MDTPNETVASAQLAHTIRRRRDLRARQLRARQIRRRRMVAAVVLATVGLTAVSAGLSVSGMLGLGGGVSPATASGRPSAAHTVSVSCPSPSLGGSLPALVYLPAGYNAAQRYPVIYFLHGLPAGPTTYEHYGFVAAALPSAHRAAIVVVPQGARSPNSDREYLDWSSNENWPRAIAHDLVACVDQRYDTIASRQGRVLAGLSAGGYGALNIGLRNLATFGAVESWSGYFAATDPTGVYVLDLNSTAADAAARVPDGPWLKSQLKRYPTYLAFYVGAQDSRFLLDNETYSATLTARGIAHTFRVYPGGHSGALWRAHASSWLANALGFLAHA